MSYILRTLAYRSKENWIISHNSEKFHQITKIYIDRFISIKKNQNNPRIILIQNQNNHLNFLSAFLAANITQCHVFLCSKKWQDNEWVEVLNLIKPHFILGNNHLTDDNFNCSYYKHEINNVSLPKSSLIMIPTGGTSGKRRFTIHTWDTLSSSVWGFSKFFGLKEVNTFCVLPLYHVSGLMQFIRSFLVGGQIVIYSYNTLKSNFIPSIKREKTFISLVPTQFKFLLTNNLHFLRKFATILLGGGPSWSYLLEEARKHSLNLSLTYGMTETASQVVTLKSRDFLKGNNSIGRVLPHAIVNINKKEKVIQINSNSLFYGYYPSYSQQQNFITDDLGYFDNKKYLYLTGRNSQKIITGGENVFPLEIENAILETNLVKDVCVLGIDDNSWGESIVAIYVPKKDDTNTEAIKYLIKLNLINLSAYKRPKHWIRTKCLSYNEQGKLNYQELRKMAQKFVLNKIMQGL